MNGFRPETKGVGAPIKKFQSMKKENKKLLKEKMSAQVGYKKQAALLDENGKQSLIDIINSGAICEIREKQLLQEDGHQTITIKFYFDENEF